MSQSKFKVGDKAYISRDGKLSLVQIATINTIYRDGRDLVIYEIDKWTLDSSGIRRLARVPVDEVDGVKTFFTRKEVVKVGARVATTSAAIKSIHGNPSAYCLNEVNPTDELSATIVDVKTFINQPIVMFDESVNYGIPYEHMGEATRNVLDKLNIPNIYGRRFSCIPLSSLSFYTSSTESSVVLTKEKTMSNKIVEMVKGDAKEAAYRVAGTQITNGVKMGVVKLFESKGGKSEHMVMLKEVLDSEVGDSLIALLLGYGLNYAPGLKDDSRIQKLSEEFRINGMAVAGNAIVGAAMESFLPVLQGALSALPEETASKPRIVESTEEEEDEEVVVPPARVSKRA